jgi:hypothetical protein
MDTGNPVIDKWSELKKLVEELELDVVKNARGVAAAGVRARKGLRELKGLAAKLVKMTVETDKTSKATKPKKEKAVPTSDAA